MMVTSDVVEKGHAYPWYLYSTISSLTSGPFPTGTAPVDDAEEAAMQEVEKEFPLRGAPL